MTCEPDCNVALCAQCTELIHIFIFDVKSAIFMLKLLRTNTQNFAARVPGAQNLCIHVNMHFMFKMDSDVHDSLIGPN
jgi:hypothetical protein